MKPYFAVAAFVLLGVAASAPAQFRVLPEHAPAEFNHSLRQVGDVAPGTTLSLAFAVTRANRPSPAVVQDFSTSALAPEGRPPAGALSRAELDRRRTGNATTDRDLYRNQNAYSRWSMMYAAASAVDGRLDTAWSEGIPGQGLGEVLVVPIPSGGSVEVFGGFGRSRELYYLNSRPRSVELTVLYPRGRIETAGEIIYQDLVVLARHTVRFEDDPTFQPLPLPDYAGPLARYRSGGRSTAPETVFLAIEILSVYQGSRWADTMISEIRATGARR